MKKIRNTYKTGDFVILKKAPTHIINQLNGIQGYRLEIGAKAYDGYNLNVFDSNGKQVKTIQNVSTKYLYKGSTRTTIIKLIEIKQTELKTITKQRNEEIDTLSNMIMLMNDLGVEEIDQEALTYAQKFSKNMGVSLKDSYRAIIAEEVL